METKVTPELAGELARAHAEGVSFRALGRLYGISASLACRHVHRVNGTPRAAATSAAEPEPVASGTEPADPVEDEPDAGGAEPEPRPTRRHIEAEWPGMEPDDDDGSPLVELSPAERRAQQQRAAREQRMREDERSELEREAERNAKEQELLAAVKAAKPGTAEWAEARRALKRFRKARPRLVPLASQAGARLSERVLRDGPPSSLWSNPYDYGPRGFDIVG